MTDIKTAVQRLESGEANGEDAKIVLTAAQAIFDDIEKLADQALRS